LLNLITISSTWARVIDVMDSEVCLALYHFLFLSGLFRVYLTYSGFSQVQDYSDLLVLVPPLDNFLGHCLPLGWLLLAHVSLHFPLTVFSHIVLLS